MAERQGQRRGQLHAIGSAVIQVEARGAVVVDSATVEGGEIVDFPVPQIGRFRIVSLVGRPGPGRTRNGK